MLSASPVAATTLNMAPKRKKYKVCSFTIIPWVGFLIFLPLQASPSPINAHSQHLRILCLWIFDTDYIKFIQKTGTIGDFHGVEITFDGKKIRRKNVFLPAPTKKDVKLQQSDISDQIIADNTTTIMANDSSVQVANDHIPNEVGLEPPICKLIVC